MDCEEEMPMKALEALEKAGFWMAAAIDDEQACAECKEDFKSGLTAIETIRKALQPNPDLEKLCQFHRNEGWKLCEEHYKEQGHLNQGWREVDEKQIVGDFADANDTGGYPFDGEEYDINLCVFFMEWLTGKYHLTPKSEDE